MELKRLTVVTKDLIKGEIDRVQDEYLEALYKIIKAFESPADQTSLNLPSDGLAWKDFINETYGCLADAPIERGDQGYYEMREVLD